MAKDADEVSDGQHAHELLLSRVPQRSGAYAVVHETEKGTSDLKGENGGGDVEEGEAEMMRGGRRGSEGRAERETGRR